MNIIKTFLNNFVVYAYLASDDLGIDESFKPILTIIIGISTALAVLSTAVCILRYMTADEGSALAKVKEDIKTVWIAYICLNSIGLIVQFALKIISHANY